MSTNILEKLDLYKDLDLSPPEAARPAEVFDAFLVLEDPSGKAVADQHIGKIEMSLHHANDVSVVIQLDSQVWRIAVLYPRETRASGNKMVATYRQPTITRVMLRLFPESDHDLVRACSWEVSLGKGAWSVEDTTSGIYEVGVPDHVAVQRPPPF